MDTVIYIAASERPLDRQMLAGVKSFAKNTGWNVQSVPDVRAKAQIAKLINMWNPLGLIVLCTTDTPPLSLFAGKPVVIIGRRQRKNESGVHYVHYDAANISELAAKELLSLQLKEYAFVTSKVPTMWSDTRLSSFKALMKLHGKVVKVFDSSQFLESEAELASSLAEWLKRLRAPAGVFAANDDIAVLVENSCQLAGLSVPDDVAIVGVDNDENMCESAYCPLTSINLRGFDLGYAAAKSFSLLISGNGNDEETVIPPCGITRRASTRQLLVPDKAARDAVELIRREANLGISAKEVLAKFPCERRSAEIRFRAAVGRSVLQEIRRRRLETAKELLKSGNTDIAAISSRCGYKSISAFSMFFRAETGQSPSSWRKHQSNYPRHPNQLRPS